MPSVTVREWETIRCERGKGVRAVPGDTPRILKARAQSLQWSEHGISPILCDPEKCGLAMLCAAGRIKIRKR